MQHAPKPRLSQQLEQGRHTLGRLMAYWVATSGLSARNLTNLASWAVGEPWLDSSALTRIKNADKQHGASIRHLLAMGALNHALWICDNKGIPAAVARFGPFSRWDVKEPWLQGRRWLQVPDHPDEPMAFADFAEVMVGTLELPWLAGNGLAGTEPGAMCAALSDLLNEAIQAREWTARVGLEQLLAAYPVTTNATARRNRLAGLVLGTATMDLDELEAELVAIAEAVRIIREIPPDGYGPADLASELNAG